MGDVDGGVMRSEGLDVESLAKHRAETGSLKGFPGTTPLPGPQDVLEVDCDILVPAAIYLAVTSPNPDLGQGWAIPTATDIAFAVGVLTLLGQRVPAGLRVLLLAIAIVDDIAAVFLIAFVYAGDLALSGLGIAHAGCVSV